MAISRRWREPEQNYRKWHCDGAAVPFELGQVQFIPVSDDITVANLIGQHGIRSANSSSLVHYEAIRAGLQRVASQSLATAASVHMPRIGCGLAGGSWNVVEGIVREELAAKGVAVTVYDLP